MQIEIEATLKLKVSIPHAPGASGDKEEKEEEEEKKTPKTGVKRKAEVDLRVDDDDEDDVPSRTPVKSPTVCQHPNCGADGNYKNFLGVKVCMKHKSTRTCEGCRKWYNDKCFDKYCGKRCQKCFDYKKYAEGGFYTQATNPTRSPRPSLIFGSSFMFPEKPLFNSKKSPLKAARERRRAEKTRLERPKLKRQESREERSARKDKELWDELADLFD